MGMELGMAAFFLALRLGVVFVLGVVVFFGVLLLMGVVFLMDASIVSLKFDVCRTDLASRIF